MAAGPPRRVLMLLLVLPALEGTGLLAAAREVYGRLKEGSTG